MLTFTFKIDNINIEQVDEFNFFLGSVHKYKLEKTYRKKFK